MKSLMHVILFLVLAGVYSCSNDDTSAPTNQVRSLSTDILGIWQIERTTGGVHGGGYEPKFDFLKIYDELKFEFIRDNSIIATGFIIEDDRMENVYFVRFVDDDPMHNSFINILFQSQHFIERDGDVLEIVSYSIDGFDTFLIPKK